MALLGTGLLLLVLGQLVQIGGIELETGGSIRGLSQFHEYGHGYFGTGGVLRRSRFFKMQTCPHARFDGRLAFIHRLAKKSVESFHTMTFELDKCAKQGQPSFLHAGGAAPRQRERAEAETAGGGMRRG